VNSRPAIVVCADDYGMSEGVSTVIADLIERGALSATTCLVDEPAWAQSAARLRRLADDGQRDIAVGLHLDLKSPWTDAGAALFGFRSQWRRFEQDFGRPPDFIDGHRHVHLFPGPKTALFRLLAELDAGCWLRQCRTSSARLSVKRVVLDTLSLGFQHKARRERRRTNPGFGGLRRFDPDEDIAAAWRQDLAAMRQGGVLMTHPGPLDSSDAISACRAQEASLLISGAVAAALATNGLEMGGRAASWTRA
jgi:predicted glycoside hydrolase/deacetylase ChbG (UPF0249 family)